MAAAAKQKDNLGLWDSVEETDPFFTKEFKRGGGFKGSATNATYLAKKATEKFGPVGIGWGWEILKEEILVGNDNTQIHKVHVEFWYKLDGEIGKFSHFGQTEFSGKRNNGNLYTDEEAPKKSLTDALTKCLSMLGFAADIHLGLFDDNKYVGDLRDKYRDADEFVQRNNARRPRNDEAIKEAREVEDEAKAPASVKERPDTKAASNDDKPSTKGSSTKAKAETKDSAKSKDDAAPTSDEAGEADQGEAASGGDGGELSDEELVELLITDVNAQKDQKELTAFMTHKDTLADLKSLPKDLEEKVRDVAKKRLYEEFKFPGKKQAK